MHDNDKVDGYYSPKRMRDQYLPGIEPHGVGYVWRTNPPAFSINSDWNRRCMLAVIDSLTAEGVTAWPGDATSCVVQIIEAYARPLAELTYEDEKLRAKYSAVQKAYEQYQVLLNLARSGNL
jgi:hypothetical protein